MSQITQNCKKYKMKFFGSEEPQTNDAQYVYSIYIHRSLCALLLNYTVELNYTATS